MASFSCELTVKKNPNSSKNNSHSLNLRLSDSPDYNSKT